MKKSLIYTLVSLVLLPTAAFGALQPSDKKEVETIVQQYLKDNPKAVFDALMAYRNDEMQKVEEEAKKTVQANYDSLFSNNKAPTLGSPDAKVSIVEFIDYQCGHCRVMGPRLKVLADSGDAKVIVRLLPIRGQSSLYASKMAIAASEQDKFQEAHHALMTAKDISTEAKVDEVLAGAGVNVEEAKKQLSAAQKQIDDNFAMASSLKLQGTPAMIFANSNPESVVFIPGAIDDQQLKAIVSKLNG